MKVNVMKIKEMSTTNLETLAKNAKEGLANY